MKNIILFFLFDVMLLFAQVHTQVHFDYAQFRYDSTKNYLEIYYSLSELVDSTEQNNFLSDSLFLNVQIQDFDSRNYVVNKTWIFDNESLNKNSQSNVSIGNLAFLLEREKYNLKIVLSDNKKNIIKEFSEEITVQPYSEKVTKISDIQLAGNIVVGSENKSSMFYKNTYEVIPKPNQFFHVGHPIIYFYSELYGLNQDSLLFKQEVIGNDSKVMLSKKKELSKEYESRVEVGYFNLKALPTSSYTLKFSLIDKSNKVLTETFKKFYYYNNQIKQEESFVNATDNYINSEFSVLSMEECEDMFDKSKILSTHQELKQYETLDSLEQKRNFLYNFWIKRDEDQSTSVNEFKNIFFERVNYVNQKYRTMSREGIKTDRGRIHLKYGEPDEIERFPNEVNSKPYEIWKYNQIEGGVMFIFGDLTGFNMYELLHSTKRGELQDPYWKNRISVQ